MRSLALQLAVLLRRTAGQDLHDRDVIVDRLQRCPDALVGEAHLDAVFLGIARREIAGVRVEHVRERVHEILEHVVGRDLFGALGNALVALFQDVVRFGPGLVGEHQRQRVVLDALAPEFVQLVGRGGPRRVLAIELEPLRRRLKSGSVSTHLERISHALTIALLESIENGERRLELARRDRVVEFVAVLLELRDVAGQEVAAHAIERFEIAIEHQGRHRIVDRRLPVMGALEHRADEARDFGVTLGRTEIGGRGVRRGGRCLGGAEQQRADREHHRGQYGGAGSSGDALARWGGASGAGRLTDTLN